MSCKIKTDLKEIYQMKKNNISEIIEDIKNKWLSLSMMSLER